MKINKVETHYTMLQKLILVVISILLAAFITLLIPDKYLIAKILAFLVGIPVIAIMLFTISVNSSLLRRLSPWKCILRTTVVALLIPIIITAIFFTHRHNYLTSAPADGYVSLRITTKINYDYRYAHIGNNLVYTHTINETAFENYDVVEINIHEPFRITSTVVENDDKPDRGSAKSQQYYYGESGDYSKAMSLQNIVKVIERKNGQSYTSQIAHFIIRYAIERVVPPHYALFDLYFFTDNQAETVILWGLLIVEIACLAYMVFIILSGKQIVIPRIKPARIAPVSDLSGLDPIADAGIMILKAGDNKNDM